MTNELVKVNSVTIDEIEFYVDVTGEHSGISKRGLARLSGVHHSTIQNFLNQDTLATKSLPERLDVLKNKDFWKNLVADTGSADIVPTEIAVKVIEYYAFESKAKNETALYSYRKFADTGMHTWIKKSAGCIEVNNMSELMKVLNQVLDKVVSLEEETKAYKNIKGKTYKIFPNLDIMLDSLAIEENLLPESYNSKLTATEWLLTKGISLDKSKRHKFAGMLAESYKSMVGGTPEKAVRTNKDGKKNNGVLVYDSSTFPVLQLCLNRLLMD